MTAPSTTPSHPTKIGIEKTLFPAELRSMENKILYRSEDDGQTMVDYYVEPNPGEDEVRWYFYPRLPQGMHWKAGDAMGGLGVMHDDTRQSFADFKLNPDRELSDEIKEEVIQAMEGK